MPKLLITSQTAREYQRRANIAWKRNQALRMAGELPPIAKPEGYIAKSITRVRKQIDLLNKRIDEELEKTDCDGQRVDRLVSALSRLRESERQLANRPLPGSLKPSSRPVRQELPPAPDIEPPKPPVPPTVS